MDEWINAQVCMTIGMQRVKAASGSIMRQTGVAYAFLYQALLVPSEALSVSTCTGAEEGQLSMHRL